MTDFVPHVSMLVKEITESGRFKPEDFQRRRFTLSQGFCLLWQDPKTGEVPGRTIDEALHVIAVAAVLLDLLALERITLVQTTEKESFLSRAIFTTSRDIIVKVVDRNCTGTFLDESLFNRILKCEKEETMNVWMTKTMSAPSHVLSTVLSSLVKMGIFHKEQKKFDRRYPTLDHEPQKALYKEVQMIALKGQIPDSYMWSLLKLTRACDTFEATTVPILAHQFDHKDYSTAMANIDKLITGNTLNKREKRKCKRHAGSFDNLLDLDST